MRILHTADWHVGRTLARKSRLDEMRGVLAEVVDIAVREEVEVVVLAGDVYEHQAPSAEAEQVVFDALLGLERAGIAVVIVAGNHDHPGRWRALTPLLRRLSVNVVSHPVRPRDGGVVELKGRGGERLQVACLPWIYERRLTGSAELMGMAGEVFQSYAEGVAGLLRGLCGDLDPDACTVLASHLYVSGATVGKVGDRTERGLTIGELYAVPPQALPLVQYAALGHVHRPQQIPGPVPARYSGSLVPLDFGEAGQEKGVVIADLSPGLPARVRVVPITRGRRLMDLTGSMEELEAARDRASDAFLRVTLTCDGPAVGLGDRVRELLPNTLEVKLDYPRVETGGGASVSGLSPREQFARYLGAKHGTDPDPEYLDLFEALVAQVGFGEELEEDLLASVAAKEEEDA